MQDNIQHLFVYGTLRRGADSLMANRLSESSDWIGEGKVKGCVYNLGDFPGAIFDDTLDSYIQGEVLSLHNPTTAFEWMDKYEGYNAGSPESNLFTRKEFPVETSQGVFLCAGYQYLGSIQGLEPLSSGDYLLHLKQNK